MLLKKRRAPSKSIKNLALRRQNYKCAKCKRPFSQNNRAQFDHTNGRSWDNSVGNCQALHAGCHDVKSRKANSRRSVQKIKSAERLTNPFVSFGFVMGNKKFKYDGY